VSRRAANTASGERRGSCVALIVGYGLPMNATSEQGYCPTVPTDQPADPRWRRFAEGEWWCASCGLLHTGLFELQCEYPEFWSGSPDKGPNAGILTAHHILTEDFCIIDGEHYFVRCVLALPLIGWSGEAFGFGVWVMLSTRSFALFTEASSTAGGKARWDLGSAGSPIAWRDMPIPST